MSSIKLKHSGGNSVSLNPPTSAPTSSDVAFKLPNADGSSGQYMKTDGSGNLAFATVATGVDGITEFDIWNMTSTSGNTDAITTISRPSFTQVASQIGTGMTFDSSTGIFTFPNTGKWLVIAKVHVEVHNSDVVYLNSRVKPANSSSYETHGSVACGANGGGGQFAANSGSSYSFIDVTDVSTVLVKFQVTNVSGSTYVYGGDYYTQFLFIRIGDT